jgi:hypothetical protein
LQIEIKAGIVFDRQAIKTTVQYQAIGAILLSSYRLLNKASLYSNLALHRNKLKFPDETS